MHVQGASTWPVVAASITLSAYNVASFGTSQQTAFGNQIMTMLNATSGDIHFEFSGFKDVSGSVNFYLTATFLNGGEDMARLLGIIYLVRQIPHTSSDQAHA